MTTEQRQAWEMLDKHFKSLLDKTLSEKEKAYQTEIGQLKGYIGQMEWKQFARENPGASQYRDRMREIQKEKGGLNCPLNLDELLVLAQKDDLKKLGAEEYKRSVQSKKKAVTTKPISNAGAEQEIEFEKGFGNNPNRRKANILKAWSKAKEVVSGK